MIKVLVIDDDVALLEAVRAFLTKSGNVEVRIARTSHEGFSILNQAQFDAIVLDYDMPDLDGLAFLRIIRSKGDTTPVIFFTGVGREHAAIEALNLGADFFVKKGENPEVALKTVMERVQQAVDGKVAGRSVGAAQKMLTDTIRFSTDPTFAVDSAGKVIAWNEAMEQLTGICAADVIRMGEYGYAEPFFGKKKKMLINLVFESDEEVTRQNYLIISRVNDGPIIAVTKGRRPDGQIWTLWMKAMPLFDVRGDFIASICTVRDITTTVKDVPLTPAVTGTVEPVTQKKEEAPAPTAGGGLLNRILGKATAAYKEGVILYARERKYEEAIGAFDRALAIDPNLGYVWNDRGLCYRELGKYDEALKSFIRAVELAPEDVEVMYDLGETLEQIGVMQRDNKYFDAALQTFQMVVDKMPNNASAWNHIGICLKEMGREGESKIYFDRARDVRLWKRDMPVPRKRDAYL